MTIVFPGTFASSRPKFMSILAIIPYALPVSSWLDLGVTHGLPTFGNASGPRSSPRYGFQSASCAWYGACGQLNATYAKNGLSDLAPMNSRAASVNTSVQYPRNSCRLPL